jgi:hypothetical protein
LNSNQALIENPSNETVTTIQTGYLEVRDSFQTPGILSLGLAGFYTSTNNGVYILGQYEQLTGSVSSFGLGYSAPDSLWLNTGSLYLSSLYLGGIGGSTYGQLTTDGTASDIYWNGTSLTSGGGGITEANLVSTTSGLQTNFIGQQASLSTLFMNMSPSTAPFWDSNTQIAGYDPEPNPLAVDIFGSLRVLKNLYIGSTTTKIGTAGIETSLLYTSTITALSLISSANILASTFTLIDTNTAASQTLAVSSGTLTLNGFGISGGGGSGDVTTAQLVSTVANFQDDFKTQKISTGFVQASTINLLDRFTNATNYLTVSTGTLLLNGGFITGSGGSAVSQIVAGSNISVSPAGGTGVVEINTTINPTGLVSTANLSGLVSTPNLQNLVSTGFFDSRLVSTVAGLGQIYVSTTSLISTVAGLGRNYVSTPSLVSTVAGLGQRYLSSFSSFSTSIGTSFTSQTGYFNTLTASNATFSNVTVSTLTFNTGDGYISMPDVVALSLSTFVMNTCTINVGFWVSTQVLNASTILSPSLVSPSELASTVIGLATSGYISSASLIGLVSTPNLLNLISTANLVGLVSTPNLSGFLSTGSILNYVSSANLIGLVSTPNLLNLISTSFFDTSLVSTLINLGKEGYVSSSQLGSTVVGLQSFVSSIYIDPTELASTVTTLISSTFFQNALASTVANLGQAGYVSSASLIGLVSTPNLSNLVSTGNLIGLVSTQNLQNLVSTANLLNLVSTTYFTSQLVSTVAGLSNVAVTQIVAGSNISISPVGGVGAVTINGNAAGLLTIPANLSTSAFFTSSIEASTTRSRILSTGLTTASTVLLYDPLSGNTGNNFIVASTFFYFNNFIIGGTRVAQPQWVVF